jgi:hypothetical protein
MAQGPRAEVKPFVAADTIWPGLKSDEETLLRLLAGLSRDDTLFFCGRANAIVSGPPDADHMSRQNKALATFCTRAYVTRGYERRDRALGSARPRNAGTDAD